VCKFTNLHACVPASDPLLEQVSECSAVTALHICAYKCLLALTGVLVHASGYQLKNSPHFRAYKYFIALTSEGVVAAVDDSPHQLSKATLKHDHLQRNLKRLQKR